MKRFEVCYELYDAGFKQIGKYYKVVEAVGAKSAIAQVVKKYIKDQLYSITYAVTF